jgi:chromosome partitioning protein
MKIIAVYSIKGGVGKTSTAVNFAWYAAKKDIYTSLIDLDPQCACMQMLPQPSKDTSNISLGQWKKIDEKEKQDYFHFYLNKKLRFFQGDQSFRKLDTILESGEKGKGQLKELIPSASKKTKLQIIDSPPGLGRLSEALLFYADAILVPLNPSELSLKTLQQLYDFMALKGIDQSKLITFFNRVSYRKKMHKKFMQASPLPLEKRLSSYIPTAFAVEAMSDRRMPCVVSVRRTKLSSAYELLFDEVLRYTMVSSV